MTIGTKMPYELLVRWKEGEITGASITEQMIIDNNGGVMVLNPEPLSIGLEKGFPVKEFLNKIQIDSLAKIEALEYELTELRKQLVEAQRVNQELINNINVNESNQTKEVER